MKFLTDYIQDDQTKAFNKADAFFAFSPKQYEEGTKEGIKYVDCGGGLFCNALKVDTMIKELSAIHKKGIKQDIEDNTIDGIIKRELENHEAEYTGDPTSTIEALQDYPIEPEQVKAIFLKG